MKRLIINSIITLSLLFATFSNASGEYHYFTRFTSRDGLPNNMIRSCLQDKDGFIWIGTKDGLYRFDGYSFFSPDETGISEKIEGNIRAICEGPDGDIWFSGSHGIGYYSVDTGEIEIVPEMKEIICSDMDFDLSGNLWVISSTNIYRYSLETKSLRQYSSKDYFPATRCAVDSNGNVWFSAIDGRLMRFSAMEDRFINVTPEGFSQASLSYMASDGDSRLLMATHTGIVYEYNISWNKADVVFSEKMAGSGTLEIHCAVTDNSGYLWVGTSRGLYIVSNGKVSSVVNSDTDPNSISGNNVLCLTKDNEGDIWIGTFYNGLNLWMEREHNYLLIYENPSDNSIKGRIVRSIYPDETGGVWIGTEDGGLNRFDISSRQMQKYDIRSTTNGKTDIQALVLDNGVLWIATYDDGLYLMNATTGKILKHYGFPCDRNASLLKTSDGEILVGTIHGLYSYDRKNDSFKYFEKVGPSFIHTLMQDSNGSVWAGTYGSGICYINLHSGNVHKITTRDSRYGLTSDFITSFYEDSSRRLWVTTEGGGVCYTSSDGTVYGNFKFNSIKKADGLPTNITCGVAEDKDKTIWISTTRGLVYLRQDNTRVEETYFSVNKIIGDQYSYGASYSSPEGTLFFGTTQGLFAFSPAKIKEAVSNRQVFITDIRAMGTHGNLQVRTPGHSIITSDVIKVKYRDISSLSIRFSIPIYSFPLTVVYDYSLQKGKKLTRNISSSNEVTYSDMAPGRYKFSVCAAGSTDPNLTRTVEIIVTPPFYQSVSAKILYLVVLAGAGIMAWYAAERRKKISRAHRISRMERQKEKEIYDAKINFFTNITHEIRTPLTLIKMPLDKIISSKEYSEKSRNDLLTIQANTDRLVNLVNQLLDIKKMDSKMMHANLCSNDICEIVRHTCSLFLQAAKEQNIDFSMSIPDCPVNIRCDRESVEKIVSNLVSNAIKYCSGKISLSLTKSEDGEKVILRINSDGDIIPSKESEKIFEEFYQIPQEDSDIRRSYGTGLGLPYSRSLATLNGGRLFLDRSVADLNSFVLELPANTEEAEGEASRDITYYDGYDGSRHSVLVVEDDAEMRDYIARELSSEYNVATAANGMDALQKMEAASVDLIVSDIMMPKMDGVQLCNIVKNNTKFSHIPVILLTAAAGLNTRMETLQAGADGYIEKPFSIELLRANISSLFKNREIAYHQFTDSPLSHFKSVTAGKADEEFMKELHNFISKNMSEQTLNLETLTEKLGTSKSTLYRKVKANTGLNINEYIRVCRLKQAAELLSTQRYRINEVAYMVGFSSPAYFTTSFQKQFNVTPSSFIKGLKKE